MPSWLCVVFKKNLENFCLKKPIIRTWILGNGSSVNHESELRDLWTTFLPAQIKRIFEYLWISGTGYSLAELFSRYPEANSLTMVEFRDCPLIFRPDKIASEYDWQLLNSHLGIGKRKDSNFSMEFDTKKSRSSDDEMEF
jgi:hypothetical protein